MKCYQVRDWDDNFEDHKSRILVKCTYCRTPNKQDGMGLNRILAMRDGLSIYGVWCLITGALSRQRPPRAGHLTDTGAAPTGREGGGVPWTAEDLAFRWRRPVKEIERALEILSSESIGWLVASDTWHKSGADPAPIRRKPGDEGRKEREKEGGRGPKSPAPAPPPLSARERRIRDAIRDGILPISPLTESDMDDLARRFAEDHPEMDCLKSITACKRYLQDKPAKRSRTTKGTRQRLTTWLRRDDEDAKYRVPADHENDNAGGSPTWLTPDELAAADRELAEMEAKRETTGR